jgi:hypothetical protein
MLRASRKQLAAAVCVKNGWGPPSPADLMSSSPFSSAACEARKVGLHETFPPRAVGERKSCRVTPRQRDAAVSVPAAGSRLEGRGCSVLKPRRVRRIARAISLQRQSAFEIARRCEAAQFGEETRFPVSRKAGGNAQRWRQPRRQPAAGTETAASREQTRATAGGCWSLRVNHLAALTNRPPRAPSPCHADPGNPRDSGLV